MSEVILLAWGLAGGADWRLMAMAAGAVWAPWPTGIAVAGAVVAGRRLSRTASAGSEVGFAESVVGELRAGASARAALTTACAGLPDSNALVRRLEVGDPLPAALTGISSRLPTIGSLIEAALAVGTGGGRMLPVFEELVVLAASEEQAREEMRVATAQIRASLWVMVGGPAAYLTWSLATGRLPALLALPGGGILGALGGFLLVAGIAAMAWMVSR